MSVSKITPLMQKALRDGAPLLFFADVWLAVLNDTVDSQSDFQESILQSNMDFTSAPGYARLAITNLSIQQLSKNTETAGIPFAYQSIKFYINVIFSSIVVWAHNPTGGPVYLSAALLASDKTSVLASRSTVISAGFDNEVSFDFNDMLLSPGTYWFVFILSTNSLRYQSSDVYADGQLDTLSGGIWTYNIGDLYFKANYKGFAASGFFRSKRLNVGELPRESGTFQMAYNQPVGAGLDITLYGYADAVTATPAVTIAGAQDGASVPPYLFWEVLVNLTSTASNDLSPVIDMLEFLYPRDSLKLREKSKALRYVDADILSDYQALLSPPEFTLSEIKIIERVASGGEMSATIEDPTGDVIQRVISGSPLKNYRASVYLGADVPGFSEQDMLRFFIGTVHAGKYKPKYRRAFSSMTLSFKNPILDLKRKAPQPVSTGVVDFSVIGLSYDAVHSIDAMLDVGRAQAGIPARYMDIAAFSSAKTAIGPTYIVRRSNAGGYADTRIKSPEEVIKYWQQLAVIADVYVTIDESSRITVIRHDVNAAAEATWADESYVRAGLDAIPIEDVGDCDLGYDQLLFNSVIMGCNWDGQKDDWTGFSKIYCHVDSDSVEEFAPGKAIYLCPMEKNMKDASKWLGPEVGYNGETIAQNLTQRYVQRFAYPPVVMKDVVVPNSEFMRNPGAVVTIWSKEFCKFKRRGIALSENKKFMVLSKKPDREKNRMVFSLLELT